MRCVTPRLRCSCRQVSAQPNSPLCVRSKNAKKEHFYPKTLHPCSSVLSGTCSPWIPGGKQQPGARQLSARCCLSARLRVWLMGCSESVSASPPAVTRSLCTARGEAAARSAGRQRGPCGGAWSPWRIVVPSPAPCPPPMSTAPCPRLCALAGCSLCSQEMGGHGHLAAPGREVGECRGLMAALFSLAAVNTALWQPPPFPSPGRPFFLLSII